jgi:Integrase core domain
VGYRGLAAGSWRWDAPEGPEPGDQFSGFLKDKKHLIHDRDPLFAEEFREILKASGIKPIRTAPMAPHLNGIMERFVRSIKSECLDRMLIFGERHLEYVIKEYMEHYRSCSSQLIRDLQPDGLQ